MRDPAHPAPEGEAPTVIQSGRAAGLRDAEHSPSLMEMMGGPLGIAESALPTIVFVIATTAGASIRDAAIPAVATALVFALARIPKRETKQFALFGVIGVAVSAWVASRTGQAKDFFLPGFLANAGYGTLMLLSVVVRRPFVGYIVGGFGEQAGWRGDPERMRRYTLASLVWVGLFYLRLAVQVPLYLTDSLVALGTAKVAMGLPLFALGFWLTWLIVREQPEEEPAATTPADGS